MKALFTKVHAANSVSAFAKQWLYERRCTSVRLFFAIAAKHDPAMEPSSHRRSFVKTTILASSASIFILILIGVAVLLFQWNAGHQLVPVLGAWLLAISVITGLTVLTACLALVTFGGIVVLHRDLCEQRGVPYVGAKEREWSSGPIMTALRRLWLPGAGLLPGEMVEVRSLPEILATLDEHGRLDALPFMPEMVAYCGNRFVVHRRVDKVWEYAHATGLRRFHNAVLLRGLRCAGYAHGGCQSACQLIWKEAWLKRPGDKASEVAVPSRQLNLAAYARIDGPNGVRYACQMTAIASAAGRWLSPWSFGHHIRDWWTGNCRLAPVVTLVAVRLFNSLSRRLGRAAWPVIQPGASGSSPHQIVGLQPGQQVRVRPKSEIESTLDQRLRNRGLEFGPDMLSCCGATYQVRARIERIVHEGTGELLQLKTPSILLEGATANGGVFMAPQNEFYFWREIWLERISDTFEGASSRPSPFPTRAKTSDRSL